MDQAIHVKRIETLGELKHAFHRFNSETRDVLDRTERIHSSIQNHLQQEEALAQNSLNSLLQTIRQPFGGQLFSISNPGVASAQARLARVRKCREKVGQEVHKYQSAAFKMRKILDHDAIKAVLTLQRKIDELEQYIGVFIFENNMEGGDHHGNVEDGAGENAEPMAQTSDQME